MSRVPGPTTPAAVAERRSRLAQEGLHRLRRRSRDQGLRRQGRRSPRPRARRSRVRIVKIETFREGDISLGQARAELAEELYKTATARTWPRRAPPRRLRRSRPVASSPSFIPRPRARAPRSRQRPPNVEETGLFARRGSTLQGLGESEPLARMSGGARPASSSVPSGRRQLHRRRRPRAQGARPHRLREAQGRAPLGLRRTKWAHYMSDFAHNACTTAQSAGKLRFNPDLVASEAPRTRRQGMPPA